MNPDSPFEKIMALNQAKDKPKENNEWYLFHIKKGE